MIIYGLYIQSMSINESGTAISKMQGIMLMMKSRNPTSLKELPMMMFGGSPMRVAVPPMLLRMTSEIRYGRGSTPRIPHISIVTGAINSMVVTLSKKALATAVRRHSNTMRRQKDPVDDTNRRTASHSKTPVWESSPTITIIPNNKPKVLHSW